MICTYRQWRISQAVDAGHPMPCWLRRHITTCPDCSAHHEEQRQVAAALTRAGEHMPEAPPFLKDRIMNAVSSTEAPEAGWIDTQWPHAIAGVSIILLLAWAFIQRPTEQPAPSFAGNKPSPETVKTQLEQPAALLELLELPGVPQPQVESALTKLGETFSAPYTSEFQNLKNDLANTRDFLGGRLAGLSLAGFDVK